MSKGRRVGVGVAALIFNQGRMLMLLRANSHGAGTWCPPGGKPDYGEALAAAAVRETKEEAGVRISILHELPYTEDFMPDWELHFITHFFVSRYLGGELKTTEPDKCLELSWVPLVDIERRPLFPPFAHFLKQNPVIWQQLLASAS